MSGEEGRYGKKSRGKDWSNVLGRPYGELYGGSALLSSGEVWVHESIFRVRRAEWRIGRRPYYLLPEPGVERKEFRSFQSLSFCWKNKDKERSDTVYKEILSAI